MMVTKKQQVARLRKLAKFLREKVDPADRKAMKEDSKKFEMGSWVCPWSLDDVKEEGKLSIKNCNTAGCMAGWGTAIFKQWYFDKRGGLRLKGKEERDDLHSDLIDFYGTQDPFFMVDTIYTPKQGAKVLERFASKLEKEGRR